MADFQTCLPGIFPSQIEMHNYYSLAYTIKQIEITEPQIQTEQIKSVHDEPIEPKIQTEQPDKYAEPSILDNYAEPKIQTEQSDTSTEPKIQTEQPDTPQKHELKQSAFDKYNEQDTIDIYGSPMYNSSDSDIYDFCDEDLAEPRFQTIEDRYDYKQPFNFKKCRTMSNAAKREMQIHKDYQGLFRQLINMVNPPIYIKKSVPKYTKQDAKIVKEINKLYDIQDHHEEVGKSTLGHLCLNESEDKLLHSKKIDPLYGEITLSGLRAASGEDCMDLASCHTLYDFGSGCGKLLLLAASIHPHIKKLIGYEASRSRYKIALNAYLKYGKLKIGERTRHTAQFTTDTGNVIIIKNMSVFDIPKDEIYEADNIFIDINFDDPKRMLPVLRHTKDCCRILSYMQYFFDFLGELKFRKRIQTTWSVENGHRFYYYQSNTLCGPSVPKQENNDNNQNQQQQENS